MKEEFFVAQCVTECTTDPKLPFNKIVSRYAKTPEEKKRMRRALNAVVMTIIRKAAAINKRRKSSTNSRDGREG